MCFPMSKRLAYSNSLYKILLFPGAKQLYHLSCCIKKRMMLVSKLKAVEKYKHAEMGKIIVLTSLGKLTALITTETNKI